MHSTSYSVSLPVISFFIWLLVLSVLFLVFHSPFLFCLNSSLIFLRATSCLRLKKKKAALVKRVILLYPAFLYPILFYSFRAPLSFSFSQLFFAPDRVSLFFVSSFFFFVSHVISFLLSFRRSYARSTLFFHPLHSRLSFTI